MAHVKYKYISVSKKKIYKYTVFNKIELLLVSPPLFLRTSSILLGTLTKLETAEFSPFLLQ